MIPKDVLIYADESKINHKYAAMVPEGHECYWTVSGRPRQTEPGREVLFTDGDRIIATAEITGLEDGRLWFEPLQPVDRPCPVKPNTRGFVYTDWAEARQ